MEEQLVFVSGIKRRSVPLSNQIVGVDNVRHELTRAYDTGCDQIGSQSSVQFYQIAFGQIHHLICLHR
jgi:hypothetical protein